MRRKKTRNPKPPERGREALGRSVGPFTGSSLPLGPGASIQAAADAPSQFRICGASEGFALQADDGTPNADGTPKLKRFAMTAYTGAAMRLSGFMWPVVVDLAGMATPRASGPILMAHDPDKPVAHWTSAEVTAQTIKLAGVMSGTGKDAKRVAAMAANGFPWQASIGANASRIEFIDRGETVKVNCRNFTGPCYVARGTVLGEVSFVPIGADGATSATVAAAQPVENPMFETWLKARGYDSATMTDAEKKLLKAAFDYEQKNPPVPIVTPPAVVPPVVAAPPPVPTIAEDIQARRVAESAEIGRINGIRRICAAQPELMTDSGVLDGNGKPSKVNLQQHAIAAGWTLDQTELAVLRASRPAGPFGYAVSPAPQITEAVMEAALLQAGGSSACRLWDNDFYLDERDVNGIKIKERRVPERLQRETQRDLNARYTDQIMQAAHTHYRGRVGLHQVLIEAARANGYQGRGETINDGNLQGILRAINWTRSEIQAEGSSTMSLSNVLANVLNKRMLEGYFMVEQAWREICAIASVKDFKPSKGVNLFGDFLFQDVGSSGELKHGSLQDQAFANQATTSGRILTIPRPIIINDDLSALTRVPMLMGRGAGLKLNKTFWTAWLGTALDDGGSTNFWAATHTITGQVGNSNYQSGASTALSSASLKAGKLLYDKQVDPKGDPLGMDAEILLFPMELDGTAWELLNSQFIVMEGLASTAAATKQPSQNRWVGKYRPVMSRYLSNSNFTGYSTTAWWLLANPQVIAAVECCFLNGQESPTVQTAEADFDILGIAMRGFFDFGVTMQNFRAGIKSAGA